MKPLYSLFLTLSIGLVAHAAPADTLSIPIGQQASSGAELPQRGMSTNEVLRRGEPSRRHPPVGEPPITRWEYPGYSVYFERDRVIHSVSQHQPVAGK